MTSAAAGTTMPAAVNMLPRGLLYFLKICTVFKALRIHIVGSDRPAVIRLVRVVYRYKAYAFFSQFYPIVYFVFPTGAVIFVKNQVFTFQIIDKFQCDFPVMRRQFSVYIILYIRLQDNLPFFCGNCSAYLSAATSVQLTLNWLL